MEDKYYARQNGTENYSGSGVGSFPEDRSLEVEDTSTFSPYLCGGTVTKDKGSETVRHVSWVHLEGEHLRRRGLGEGRQGLDLILSCPCRSLWTEPCWSPVLWLQMPVKFAVLFACIKPSVRYTSSSTSMVGLCSPGIL